MVLAISLVIMLLLTLRRVTGALPMISLRSAKASQGKNLSIRIFAFLLLLLVVSDSPGLYRGGRCGSSTRRPAFLFAHFAILQRPLLWGRLRLVVYLFINRLQLFLTSFFRVFFSWFLVSLYCLSSSGSWLLSNKNTKLRKRKRGRQDQYKQNIEPYAKALVIGEPIKGVAEYSRWRYLSTVTLTSRDTSKGRGYS